MDNEKIYNEEIHSYAININEENLLNSTKVMGLFSLSLLITWESLIVQTHDIMNTMNVYICDIISQILFLRSPRQLCILTLYEANLSQTQVFLFWGFTLLHNGLLQPSFDVLIKSNAIHNCFWRLKLFIGEPTQANISVRVGSLPTTCVGKKGVLTVNQLSSQWLFPEQSFMMLSEILYSMYSLPDCILGN